MINRTAFNKIAEESSALQEIPPLSQILGLVEGQIIVKKHGYDMHKFVITELFDEHLVFENNSVKPSLLRLKDIEHMVESGQLILLKKDGKPVLGRKKHFNLFGSWMVR